jgi:hypothetical protein
VQVPTGYVNQAQLAEKSRLFPLLATPDGYDRSYEPGGQVEAIPAKK